MSTQKQAITTLIQLSENVFHGDAAYSLMANLNNLRDEDWNTAPPGGERSIADILEHVGWAKWMYQDYAFGPGTLQQPPLLFLQVTHSPAQKRICWSGSKKHIRPIM